MKPGLHLSSLQLRTLDFDVVNIDVHGNILSRQQREAQCHVEILGGQELLQMVLIPSGKFLMGSPMGEGYDSEQPQHEVVIPSFLISSTLITQAQWRKVANLPQVVCELNPEPSCFKGDNLPVERISWWDAIEFCERLSLASVNHYRLPSEAEWEYCCRAGTSTPFHFGETITGSLANYNSTYVYAKEQATELRHSTTDVDFFTVRNPFGLSDMHGNLWEWCADHRHDNYEGASMDGSAWLTDYPDCDRVIRGGAWGYKPKICRSGDRLFDPPFHRHNIIGFRVACSLLKV